MWSPLGNQIAWIELSGPSATAIKILDIASKKTVSIAQPNGIVFDANFDGYSNLAWLPDGRHLLVLIPRPTPTAGKSALLVSLRATFIR